MRNRRATAGCGAPPRTPFRGLFEKSPLKTLKNFWKKIQAAFAFENEGLAAVQRFRLWWKPVAYTEPPRGYGYTTARFPPASEILQTQRSGVPQAKSCALPAKRGGSQAGTGGMRFRKSGLYRSDAARRLLQMRVRDGFRRRFQKKTRSLTLPKPDFRRTSRREHGEGRRAGRRTSRLQKTFCGAEAAFCLRASASLLLGGQGTSRKFPPAAEILRSNAAIAALLLRPPRTRRIIPYCAGNTHTGRIPSAAAQTPSRG